MMFSNKSLIHQIASVALALMMINCGRLSQSNNDDTVCDIDINDTAMVKSAIYSVYASDTIYWPGDFDDLDTLDLVNFVSIKAHIPSLNPDSLTKTFGPCIEEDSFSFDESPWYESDEAKGIDIQSDLIEENYHIDFDKLIPILSRIDGKWKISHKRWRFDDNHFIEIYYLSSDTTLIPIDGDIIHQAHPILEME